MPKINEEEKEWLDSCLNDELTIYQQRAQCKRHIKECEIELQLFFDGLNSAHYLQNTLLAFNLCELYLYLSESYQRRHLLDDFKVFDKAMTHHLNFDKQLAQLSEQCQWQLSSLGTEKIIDKINQLKIDSLTNDTFDDPHHLREFAKLYFQLTHVIYLQRDDNCVEQGLSFRDDISGEADSGIMALLQELQANFSARTFLKTVLKLKRRCDELSPYSPGENSSIYQKILINSLTLVDTSSLEKLAQTLHHEECVNLINGLWLCHLNADEFYPQFNEKKVELLESMRLIPLHQFIEDLFSSLNIVMKLRGKNEYQDKLLHGNNYPANIKLSLDLDHKNIILDCIKELMLQAKEPTDGDDCMQIIDEMRHAFKYRFDPNRFIDALMSLGKVLQRTNSFDHGNNSVGNLQRYFSVYYKKASSQNLLIFFRHFQGHDLNYLMSTLDALSRGHHFDWLVLSEELHARSFFRDVYLQIDTLMQLLRKELARRSIETSAYRYQSPRENLSVRKRNRACLMRLVDIYLPLCNDLESNDKIEALFEQLSRD